MFSSKFHIHLTLSLLFLTTILGCGSPQPPVKTASGKAENKFFNLSMIGQTWTFVDGEGNHTFIEIQPSPAGSAAEIVLHVTKDNCKAWWNPGDCSSNLWFGLKQNLDSSWSAAQFLAICNFCIDSHNQGSVTIAAAPGGYLIVPPNDNFTTGHTGYNGCWAFDQLTWVPTPCTTGTSQPWITNGYMENVVTPVYSGPALVSEQQERTCPDNCAWEKWYFAPNIGIVKIIQLQNGAAPYSVPIVLVRTN